MSAAAVPLILGLLLLAGESGSVAVIWGAAGAPVSIVKAPGGRGRVGVSGAVGRPDLEGVVAVGQVGVGLRRGAGGQSAGWAESRRHSKEEPGSSDEKPKEGLGLEVVPVGPESIWVLGAPVSIVKAREAGVGSVLAAPSVALTSKVWLPSARLV